MDVTVQTYQRLLDDAWDTKAERRLRESLRDIEKNLAAQFSSVGSLTSVSKNSTSQSYAAPGLGRYTAAQLADVLRDLITLHDTAIRVLVMGGAAADPGDQLIYDSMKTRLNVVTEVGSDITELLLQPTVFSGQVTI